MVEIDNFKEDLEKDEGRIEKWRAGKMIPHDGWYVSSAAGYQ